MLSIRLVGCFLFFGGHVISFLLRCQFFAAAGATGAAFEGTLCGFREYLTFSRYTQLSSGEIGFWLEVVENNEPIFGNLR